MTRPLLWLAAALLAGDKAPAVGRVVIYGDLTLREAVRAALPKSLGTASEALVEDLRKRVAAVPGVRQSDVSLVCCEADGTATVYAGVKRDDTRPRFRPTPNGPSALAAEDLALYEQLSAKLEEGVLKGEAAEDEDEGHSLSRYAPAHELQNRAARRAAGSRAAEWRQVALTASNPKDRAAAAYLVAYGPKNQALADALATAARDPDEQVRNNALRALGVLAVYAAKHPGLKLDAAPALSLFDSVVWTDWNKASFALHAMVDTGGSDVLDQLRQRDLTALRQMAQWPAAHAYAAQVILKKLDATPSPP